MRKFEFNELSLNMIHHLYQNDNPLINNIFKEGVLVKFIKLHFNNKPIFINSHFNWETNEGLDLIAFNDINLLVMQESILSAFRLHVSCGSRINAFGLLKIWIKILATNNVIYLTDCLSPDFVFEANPDDLQTHIDQVQKEISQSPLINLILKD
jgi:hypothetical protein